MKKLLLSVAVLLLPLFSVARSWVRVNEIGYLPDDIKVAVIISDSQVGGDFEVRRFIDDSVVYRSSGTEANAEKWGMKSAYRLDFSSVEEEGGYYIVADGARSSVFSISWNAYDGAADYLLKYLRQQRCGYNPFNDAVCHADDGYIVDHPTRSGEKIDVTGGWHDASDYLQYVTTSATTVYDLLFAYDNCEDKSVFADRYDASGREGANGIPDILDEAAWGLEWLKKMNPEDGVMFSQIADDRDHAGYCRPHQDQVDYGWGPGKGRPVYYVTGEKQGLGPTKNRSTGKASVAAKFSSSFALGAKVFKDINPEFSAEIWNKALSAYKYAEDNPGVFQTACLKSKYFYEEDNYTDDVELAAATIYGITGDPSWLVQADYWGELEPVTPWMELGRGRHYQYYPFKNTGHYILSASSDQAVSSKYTEYLRAGLQSIKKRAEGDPFLIGIPFLWCSNNLVSAALTQAYLYGKLTGDTAFEEMRTALRDWLFGCNPWGTSMVTGLPADGDYPSAPHSAYYVLDRNLTYGGLVDGPVYRNIFLTRAGSVLTEKDAYAPFNNGIAVYHDDYGDYSSNEPTMDGTAGLVPYLAATEAYAKKHVALETVKDQEGAVVRINPESKDIYLVFTADSMFQGGESVLRSLKKAGIKASFFVTGNFLRMEEHKEVIGKIIKEGHYLGPHSDRHLLYASWTDRDSSYVTVDSLLQDMKANIAMLAGFGIADSAARWVIPPYEWYNAEQVDALNSAGFKVMNYTPGTATAADYTYPALDNYVPTYMLIDRLMQFEKVNGLNGAVILIHPGVTYQRPDKLYSKLPELIKMLKKEGYSFKRLY